MYFYHPQYFNISPVLFPWIYHTFLKAKTLYQNIRRLYLVKSSDAFLHSTSFVFHKKEARCNKQVQLSIFQMKCHFILSIMVPCLCLNVWIVDDLFEVIASSYFIHTGGLCLSLVKAMAPTHNCCHPILQLFHNFLSLRSRWMHLMFLSHF